MPSVDVLDVTPRIQYYAAAAQTVFTYPFVIFSSDEVVVQNGVTVLSEGADYSVTNVGVETGGTVVLTSGAALDDVITIYRESSRARSSQYQPDGKLGASPLERDFDRIFTILQEDARDVSRTIRLAPEDQLTEFTLPTDRANKFLSFNSLGVPVASEGPTSAGTPFGATGIDLAATATPSEARTVIGLASYAALKSVYSLGDLADKNEVTNALMADMVANTVKVRAANTTGEPSDLAIGANQVLGRGPTGDLSAQTIVTPWVAYTPTFTGFGTAASISFFSRRVGDSLQVRGQFTSGTPTGTEARITLGYDGTNGGVTTSSTKLASGVNLVGDAARSNIGGERQTALAEQSAGYLTFGIQNAGNSGLTKANGDTLVGAGNVYSINAEVPISGW